jgi:hypothetical protein
MTRADKLLLAGLVLISLLSMAALYSHFSAGAAKFESSQAVILVQGKILRKIDLTPATRSSFTIQGRLGPSIVEVEGKRIRMMEAPCAGKICVNQKWIENPGQTIVCIPGEILIRIEGTAPLDAVTR